MNAITQNKNGSVMTECYQTSYLFPPIKRRKVDVNFDGGEIS
ncbi:hypothetical Protein YC6258_03713 [Gynuella sunshinyii YC6258]|uniref:Uncharacterized protein n=1 Tax=Gynuella sunshinyii YC6258 TaxID=1445510 RepID=A0A0C5VZC5_9GAMM|nr:hypothetical Protein YC6258_03713 [Gynuella sunshinyii YC6258]